MTTSKNKIVEHSEKISNSNFFSIARGLISGVKSSVVSSHNPTLPNGTEEDIWEEGGTLVYLSSAETMEVVSDSINDTSAGTGAQAVSLEGLDSNYDEISETIIMAGTTPVTSSLSYLRVRLLTVSGSGSLQSNDGVITAEASTASTIQCHLNAREGASQNSHFTVPNNKNAYVIRVSFQASKLSGGGTPEVEWKGLAMLFGSNTWIQVFDVIQDSTVQNVIDVDQPIMPLLPPKTDIRLTGTSDTVNTDVNVRMYLVIEDI
ncbi:hypothetical protein LCGC14_2311430 [marine sediment metagenome]|uniref:Uncharacterized protein n=1 Tax=marine sediment metagenome TaxID=412755 RepID=A0A0F9EXX5_9ZZZZ